jgi:hypothetical protein
VTCTVASPIETLTEFLPSTRSDRCSWLLWALCGICLGWTTWSVRLWVVLLLVSSWQVWRCFVRLCVGFFFFTGCVLEVFLFQGLEKSLGLSGTLVVRLLQPPAWSALSTGLTGVTGLSGVGHRSDQCSTGSKPCKFPMCVFLSFGSEGYVLVPRINSTPVAMWSWPTLVVESETCVGSRVHLGRASISFEKNFYWLPFTPPSLVRRSGPSVSSEQPVEVHQEQVFEEKEP